MSRREEVQAEPARFDLLDLLRELERATPNKPRIGTNIVRAEEVVRLGQDPFLEFPGANVTALEAGLDGVPHLQSRFLGFFGPQGALPLNTTIEAYGWSQSRDKSYVQFVDIFANRFLQLFFRAWADARPAAQHDRPAEDRFARFIGSFGGLGTEPFLDRDSVPDLAKLPLAGLVGARVKSATRLEQVLSYLFGIDAQVTERIGSWLTFEPDDVSTLGGPGARLGQTAMLGERTFVLDERFRITIRTQTLEQYADLLPGGKLSEQIADAVFYTLGFRFGYDIELALPAKLAPQAQLGQFGQLGWTTWLPPAEPPADDAYLSDARIDLQERRRAAQVNAMGVPA
ncbi:MAG TPA: type VI secretion system baseplate subunit TssG [Devosia sp.]|nr:type VI secretion system baseplate subunit TssG [Devosia sp.]